MKSIESIENISNGEIITDPLLIKEVLMDDSEEYFVTFEKKISQMKTETTVTLLSDLQGKEVKLTNGEIITIYDCSTTI